MTMDQTVGRRADQEQGPPSLGWKHLTSVRSALVAHWYNLPPQRAHQAVSTPWRLKSLPTMVTSRVEHPVARAVSLDWLTHAASVTTDTSRSNQESVRGRFAAPRELTGFDARMGD